MLFSKPRSSSAALIDINSTSVGAALVHYQEGKSPSLCYTVRIPIEESGDELTTQALRVFEEVANRLVREGAPALRAAAGNGRVDTILVALGRPWQEASVETKKVQKVTSFTFTKSFIADLLGTPVDAAGRSVTRTVIATLLNGYLTPDPYGKEAKRAEVVVLSTSLDDSLIDSVERILRSAFSTRDTRYTPFLEPAYHALKFLYPHEKDFLLLSVTKEATEIFSAKRGYLLDAGAISCGSKAFSTGKECVESLSGLLREFAIRHALPRTIFLLADEKATGVVKEALNDSTLRALWLSDVPLTIVPVQASLFSGVVATRGVAEGDARLAMLAVTAQES